MELNIAHWLIVAGVIATVVVASRARTRGASTHGSPPATSDHFYRQIANVTNTTGEYWLELVGESNYRDAIAEGLPADYAPPHYCEVFLVPEPENPHDANAIAAYLGERKVGYLSRKHAKGFAAQVKANGWQNICFRAPAVVYGGTDGKRDYGIWIDLPR